MAKFLAVVDWTPQYSSQRWSQIAMEASHFRSLAVATTSSGQHVRRVLTRHLDKDLHSENGHFHSSTVQPTRDRTHGVFIHNVLLPQRFYWWRDTIFDTSNWRHNHQQQIQLYRWNPSSVGGVACCIPTLNSRAGSRPSAERRPWPDKALCKQITVLPHTCNFRVISSMNYIVASCFLVSFGKEQKYDLPCPITKCDTFYV